MRIFEMQKIPRFILINIFAILLISSGCSLYAPTRIPVGPIGFNPSPTPAPTNTQVAASDTPVMPVIPITGDNAVLMQCQFCVNELTHAILIFPEAATFNVEGAATPATCLTAQVVNGKRVLICHGTQLTSFNLKICSDAANCLFFPVALQACPLVPNTGTSLLTSTPMTPVFLTPLHTPRPTNTDDLLPPATSTSGGATSLPSATAAPNNTPVPTSIPPTVAPTNVINTPVPTSIVPTIIVPTSIINTPVPTDPPAATEPQPTSPPDDNKKDTKTPKPKN